MVTSWPAHAATLSGLATCHDEAFSGPLVPYEKACRVSSKPGHTYTHTHSQSVHVFPALSPRPLRDFFFLHASIFHLHNFLLAAFQTHDILCPSTSSNIRFPSVPWLHAAMVLYPPRIGCRCCNSKSTAPGQRQASQAPHISMVLKHAPRGSSGGGGVLTVIQ